MTSSLVQRITAVGLDSSVVQVNVIGVSSLIAPFTEGVKLMDVAETVWKCVKYSSNNTV